MITNEQFSTSPLGRLPVYTENGVNRQLNPWDGTTILSVQEEDQFGQVPAIVGVFEYQLATINIT
jgi:hypothetical protein